MVLRLGSAVQNASISRSSPSAKCIDQCCSAIRISSGFSPSKCSRVSCEYRIAFRHPRGRTHLALPTRSQSRSAMASQSVLLFRLAGLGTDFVKELRHQRVQPLRLLRIFPREVARLADVPGQVEQL